MHWNKGEGINGLSPDGPWPDSDKRLNKTATNTNHSLLSHSVKETRVKKCQGKGVGRFEFTEDDCAVDGVPPEQAMKAKDDGFV